MSDIKFRCWSLIHKHWIDPKFLNVERGSGDSFFVPGILSGNEGVIVDLFTGLKDKNGKEIYEGDICKTSYGTAAVAFSKRGGSFIWNIGYAGTYIIDAFRDENDNNLTEVIGNIYENPELLK